mmetsp:Transcript_28073/g.70493  ORF Transcript_28073/g.70493 Transcript_28073/m.70493 type:complete len:303 (+) Transcript_28073:465-1373(+)
MPSTAMVYCQHPHPHPHLHRRAAPPFLRRPLRCVLIVISPVTRAWHHRRPYCCGASTNCWRSRSRQTLRRSHSGRSWPRWHESKTWPAPPWRWCTGERPVVRPSSATSRMPASSTTAPSSVSMLDSIEAMQPSPQRPCNRQIAGLPPIRLLVLLLPPRIRKLLPPRMFKLLHIQLPQPQQQPHQHLSMLQQSPLPLLHQHNPHQRPPSKHHHRRTRVKPMCCHPPMSPFRLCPPRPVFPPLLCSVVFYSVSPSVVDSAIGCSPNDRHNHSLFTRPLPEAVARVPTMFRHVLCSGFSFSFCFV